ncbi:hypothetical protein GCM10010335_69750 [Streptomyces galbus]|nr:hypothetical protein GCM10010335_69750 [Streptomyces galbus]
MGGLRASSRAAERECRPAVGRPGIDLQVDPGRASGAPSGVDRVETSIKVSKAARDRLTELTADHGTTIRSLVEDLAQRTPTQAEYGKRAELARAELASALGSAPSPEAEAKARALLKRLGAAAHGPRAAAWWRRSRSSWTTRPQAPCTSRRIRSTRPSPRSTSRPPADSATCTRQCCP